MRTDPPGYEEIVSELTWIVDCGERHWGSQRASRNLRKFYPWYLERLQITGIDADAWQRTEGLDEVRERLLALGRDRVAASL